LLCGGEQAVETRNSDIDQTLDWMTKGPGYYGGFLGNGQVTGPGGDDQDGTGA
jgi:hypothetical protein